MKIEMGESLFYSWLRHVKECQIVQTNWKVSQQWNLQNEADLELLMKTADHHFSEKYNYSIFKKNTSLSQVLQQGECDAIGISLQNNDYYVYAVDVAFHENGLNYGSREETIMKVIAKTVRTAMCIWGYLNTKAAEIVFASPKIMPSIMKDLEPCIVDINTIFKNCGFEFKARIIANQNFNEMVLQPILIVSDDVADTSELFLRAYQMFNMFSKAENRNSAIYNTYNKKNQIQNEKNDTRQDKYNELKVGKLARTVMGRILEQGLVSHEELIQLQMAGYSKTVFDLQYPLLVKSGVKFDSVRYYAQPLIIHGDMYYMCSQWFETASNNDRPYLIKWIMDHENDLSN